MRRGIWGFLIVLLAVAEASADDGTEAGNAFARGTALHTRGDFPAAIAAFERAYRLQPHHAVLCSIALCHERLSRFVEAAAHYRRCLDEGAVKTPKAEKVRKALAGVEARITHVEVKSPGAGGTVVVDGVALGPAPRRVPLDPGRHVLEVRREGAASATVTLGVLSGEERTLTLVPTSKAAVFEPEALPWQVTALPTEKPTPPRADPPSRRRLSPAWFWTTVGLTAALGGAAAVMGGLTYKAGTDYDAKPTRDSYQTFVDRRLVTNVLAGLAIAAGGTGTVLFFYTDFSGRRGERAASASLGIRGAF